MSDSRPPKALARPAGIARHGRLKKASPWGALIGLIGIIVAVALVSTTGIAGIAVATVYGHINGGKAGVKIAATPAIPPTVGAYPGGFNILIVGSDTRVGQGGIGGSAAQTTSTLNDVTMLFHVSADHTNATAISIPRDMIVPIASCKSGGGLQSPMNTALFYGGSTDKSPGAGLPCAVKTVEQLTGLSIQFAGLITFKGVVEVTDAIGGVTVCAAGAINDKETGLHLKKGTSTIHGYQALAFLRSRHGVGDGSDLGRISSQQVYLSSLVRKLKSDNTLSDPATLYKIADAATENMVLSQGFDTPVTILALAQALRNIPLDRVIFTQYPGTTQGVGVYAGKVQPLTSVAAPMLALIKADKPFKLASNTGDRGSVKGKAPKSGTKSSTTSTSTPTGTATPTPTSTSSSSKSHVATVNGIVGQSSSEYTCSKPYTP